MSGPGLHYVTLLPFVGVLLVGAGLVSETSWLFSVGLGLLLASVAVLIIIRRSRRP